MPSLTETIVGAVVAFALREGTPLLWKAYKNRRIEPKKAEQQYLLDVAAWFADRAKRLNALQWQLLNHPDVDKWQLATLVSKLDRDDQQWAMRITDVELLRKRAIEKATECEDNAADSARNAGYIDTHTLL
jgi:hypothetical protein